MNSGAELQEDRHGARHQQHGSHQRQRPVTQDEPHERVIGPDQEPVDRVLLLRRDLAADEEHHQERHDEHRGERRKPHREGLGEGQRAEQPALLRLEREDRQERHRDDEQREEQRPSDLLRGLDEDLAPRLRPGVVLEMLVGVLDHDDRGVDHRADGDRDAAQAHDVRAETDVPHRHE